MFWGLSLNYTTSFPGSPAYRQQIFSEFLDFITTWANSSQEISMNLPVPLPLSLALSLSLPLSYLFCLWRTLTNTVSDLWEQLLMFHYPGSKMLVPARHISLFLFDTIFCLDINVDLFLHTYLFLYLQLSLEHRKGTFHPLFFLPLWNLQEKSLGTHCISSSSTKVLLMLYCAEGNGNLRILWYSCLGNPMNRGAWWATVHGVTRVRHNLATKPPPTLYWDELVTALFSRCRVNKHFLGSWQKRTLLFSF